MTAIRVMLADDHSLFRAGIRALLEAIEGVEIVGEARDGQEALRMVAERRPEIVLLDVALPQLNGIEVTEPLERGLDASGHGSVLARPELDQRSQIGEPSQGSLGA